MHHTVLLSEILRQLFSKHEMCAVGAQSAMEVTGACETGKDAHQPLPARGSLATFGTVSGVFYGMAVGEVRRFAGCGHA